MKNIFIALSLATTVGCSSVDMGEASDDSADTVSDPVDSIECRLRDVEKKAKFDNELDRVTLGADDTLTLAFAHGQTFALNMAPIDPDVGLAGDIKIQFQRSGSASASWSVLSKDNASLVLGFDEFLVADDGEENLISLGVECRR